MSQIKESNEKNLIETSYSSMSSLHKLTTDKEK
jgi:ribosomal protein L20A (L18A)